MRGEGTRTYHQGLSSTIMYLASKVSFNTQELYIYQQSRGGREKNTIESIYIKGRCDIFTKYLGANKKTIWIFKVFSV